jgi:hypothetical protein
MSTLKKNSHEDARKAEKEHSSQGKNSAAETPKDVTAEDAASRDLTERKIASSDPDEKEQAQLDDAVELSFPASDPPGVTGGVTRIDPAKKK